MAISLIVASLLLFAGAEKRIMKEDVPSTRPATQPTSQPAERQVVSIRLLEPQAEVDELHWTALSENVSSGSLFREVRTVVADSAGRRFEVEAYNVFATAYKDKIGHIDVRPAWPTDTGENLAERLERQLRDWQVQIGEKERASLDELRRMGPKSLASGSGMWAYHFLLPGDTRLRVRIQGVTGEGWFAVFEFSAPRDQRLGP